MEIEELTALAGKLENISKELKSNARELGISEKAINSCGDSLICLIGLIKYKYLKNNLDKVNKEVENAREEILKIEQEVVKKLFIDKLNKTDEEIQDIFESLDLDVNVIDR
jgi:DNA mismatch repair ATPase MutS